MDAKLAYIESKAGELGNETYKKMKDEIEKSKRYADKMISDIEAAEELVANPEKLREFLNRYNGFVELAKARPNFEASDEGRKKFYEWLKSEGKYDYYNARFRELSHLSLIHMHLFKELIESRDLPAFIIKLLREMKEIREHLEGKLKA